MGNIGNALLIPVCGLCGPFQLTRPTVTTLSTLLGPVIISPRTRGHFAYSVPSAVLEAGDEEEAGYPFWGYPFQQPIDLTGIYCVGS